jgi:DUF1680 family protein
MFLLTGESKYMDMVERTLYNGILGGIGLDGKSFYYANPMEYATKRGKLSGENQRSPWFTCSCCPSNVCRFMPSIPGYIYAKKDNALYINLFIGSETSVDISSKEKLGVKQSGNMPWSGNIDIEITEAAKKGTAYTLKLRIPGWAMGDIFPTSLYVANAKAKKDLKIKLNGTEFADFKIDNGYLVILRSWKKSDKIELDLPMDVISISSDEKIKANKNLISLQKGPLMYCAEFADNQGKTSNIYLPDFNTANYTFDSALLGGIEIIETKGKVVELQNNSINTIEKNIKLIPYYARSNRGVGEMNLWFKTKVSNVILENE